MKKQLKKFNFLKHSILVSMKLKSWTLRTDISGICQSNYPQVYQSFDKFIGFEILRALKALYSNLLIPVTSIVEILS